MLKSKRGGFSLEQSREKLVHLRWKEGNDNNNNVEKCVALWLFTTCLFQVSMWPDPQQSLLII